VRDKPAAVEPHHESRAALAVRGHEQEHEVFGGVDAPADALQHGVQVDGGGERVVIERVGIVHEHERAAAGIEAGVEQLAHTLHFLAEYVLVAVEGDADEVEVAHARPLRLEFRERFRHHLGLTLERGLEARLERGIALRGLRLGEGRVRAERERHDEEQAANERAHAIHPVRIAPCRHGANVACRSRGRRRVTKENAVIARPDPFWHCIGSLAARTTRNRKGGP
jgi:hypothetical protein